MRKLLFYFLVIIARTLKILRFKFLSRSIYQNALTIKGIKFAGSIRYIDFNVYLDPTAGISIGHDIVISTNVIMLTHDYSYTTGLASLGKRPVTDIAYVNEITLGDNVFIGAGSIIMPGTHIGSNVIVGAGSLVTGKVESNSIVAGNPAKKIADIQSWAKQKEDRTSQDELLIDRE